MMNSTNHMFRGNKLLKEAGIQTKLLPAPTEYGSVCATAISVEESNLEQAKAILNKHQVSIFGIYLEKRKKLDQLIATLKEETLSSKFLEIIKKIELGDELPYEDIVYLLKIRSKKEMEVLFSIANRMRQEIIGDVVDVRGAIEFSNICKKDCLYCGIRKSLPTLNRYRMTEEEIMEIVYELNHLGIQTVILQSGEDPWWTKEKIVHLIKRIKRETQMKITLSLGERSYEEYALFKEAGANNYLLKIETTNPKIFKSVHPDDDFEIRVQCSKWLSELGYLNGSGIIIGLPGQAEEDIAKDILFFKEMGINMIGIGPFIPAVGTPLEDYPSGNVELTLKAVAVTRIVCKRVFLPATTALASLDGQGQEKALEAGANVIMLVNTPAKYRGNYQIYSNKNMVDLTSAIKAITSTKRQMPDYLKLNVGE